jgi:hypothetical protein
MDANRTLRVVGGLHEGAHLDLPSGEYIVGRAAHCDIVLHDEGVAPEHVKLRIEGSTVQLSSIASAGAECRGRRLGSGVHRLRESDVVTVGSAAFCVTAATNLAQTQVAESTQRLGRARPSLLGRAVAPYALLGVLAVGTVFVYAEVVSSGQSAEVRAQNGLAQARQAIRSAHLDEISVGLTPSGRLSATGYVRTVRDAQRLAAEPALTALGAPVLRYHVAQEIVARVKQHLDPAPVEVSYAGQGKIAVSGRGDASLRERMRRLSRDLDGVAVIDDQLVYVGATIAPPPQALKLPIRIVAVQSGAPSYFEDQHGARYFVGGSLSDGAQVTAIEDGQILFNKNGKSMRYALDQHGGEAHVYTQ